MIRINFKRIILLILFLLAVNLLCMTSNTWSEPLVSGKITYNENVQNSSDNIEEIRKELSLNSRWILVTPIGLITLIAVCIYLYRKELRNLFFYRKDKDNFALNNNTFLVIITFIILTLIMTYPLVFRAFDSLTNLGDPLFNTYMLWWNWESLLNFWRDYYNPPIFYPNINTIAYNENLFFIGLYTAPIYFLTKNPLLAYNFALFLSYFLSGLGMFYLTKYLIKRVDLAFLSGILFAFASYHFSKRSHLNIGSYQWIPFILLFLHKYKKKYEFRAIIVSTLFTLFQCLSSLHVGIFSLILVSLFLIYHFVFNKRFRKKKILLGIIFSGIIFFIIFYPIMLPYFYHKKLGFTRSLNEVDVYSADLISYLTTIKSNLLWGFTSVKYGKAEAQAFFPGLLITAFLIYGALNIYKTRYKHKLLKVTKNKVYLALELINIFITLLIIFIFLIIMIKGIRLKIFWITLSVHKLKNPLYVLSFFLFLKAMLHLKLIKNYKLIYRNSLWIDLIFYLILILIAGFLTLGPTVHLDGKEIGPGLYILFYKYMPGFEGMRTPGRFYILVLTGFCILSVYGIYLLFKYIPRNFRLWLSIIFSLIILLENYNGFFPFNVVGKSQQYTNIPQKLSVKEENIPQFYRWLLNRNNDNVVIELPYNDFNLNFYYQYYSMYHKKKLVNGFSSYIPRSYYYIQHLLRNFPDSNSIDFLKEIDVDLIIFHSEFYHPDDAKKLESRLISDTKDFKELANFSGTIIFRLLKNQEQIKQNAGNFNDSNIKCKPISLEKCKFESSGTSKEFIKLYDNNFESSFLVGSQNRNQFIQVEFPQITNICSILMYHKYSPQDSPAGLQIYCSNNGKNWQLIWEQNELTITPRHLISQSGNFYWNIFFKSINTKFVIILSSNTEPNRQWSISEMKILSPYLTSYDLGYLTPDKSVYNFCDKSFIVGVPIIVISPNGGESWQRGTRHIITWTSNGNIDNSLRITLWKGNSYYMTIINPISNSGSHPWDIPISLPTGSDFRIKITSNTDGSIYDMSDNYFIIW